MKKQNNAKKVKVIFGIIALVIIIVSIIYFFPMMKELSTLEGKLEFKRKIQTTGIYGFLFLSLLQIAQILLIILPGEPLEILAGMCYGKIWGTLFIMITSTIISTIIFILVKKYEKKFVHNFYDKEKIKKIEKNRFFKNPKKIERILFILFLIPGTPKDLLVYVSGLFPIKTHRFILITTIARIPSIVTSTIAGDNLMKGSWKSGIILYLVITLIIVVGVYIYNIFDKDKTADKAIDAIK